MRGDVVLSFVWQQSFVKFAPYSGVDENLPTAGQGIVVPSGGSTVALPRWHGQLTTRLHRANPADMGVREPYGRFDLDMNARLALL